MKGIALALVLCAASSAAWAQGNAIIDDGGSGGFTSITPSDWIRRYLFEKITTENLPRKGSVLVEPPDPKPGEHCIISPVNTINCGISFKCRAYVGLPPNTHEELWEPRREENTFVCDEADRPSVKASTYLNAK